MKTLLLTSAGTQVKEEILKILPRSPHEMKLVYITTASSTEEEKEYVQKDRKSLLAMGFQVNDFDIVDKKESEVRKFLNRKDIIYVQGGNTFYLLQEVRKSGFDKIVKELINRGKIYIGVSAGSYITCPTIEMANWKISDKNIVNLTDLSGLNLIPFLLSVHYEPKYKNVLREEIAKSKFQVKILTDEQALLIKGDDVTLVGKGPEIIL